MAERVSMSEEMISADAGSTLTVLAERFLTAVLDVLAGKDFRRFSLVRAEVRGGMTGPIELSMILRSPARAGWKQLVVRSS